MHLQYGVHGHDGVICNFIGVCYMSVISVNISSQVQIHVLRGMTANIFVSKMLIPTIACVMRNMC